MTTLDQHVERVERDGYTIIERAFSESYCDAAVDALHRIQREQGLKPTGGFSGANTVRVMNLLQYDDLFQELPAHDGFLPVIEEYLDRECLLSGIDSSEVLPGEVAQPVHTDSWWHDNRRFDFPICVNTILTLTDFTEANGATVLVPGSHRWTAEQVAFTQAQDTHPLLPGAQPEGYGKKWTPIAAECPKGSILLYDSRLMHGAGANRTDRARPSIISPYVLGWVRQLDNFAYALPFERMRGFPPRLQQLVGLDLVRGGYSNVNNKSPKEWLWG
jgi:ectoine hydroxylase-related dioxygenase (phytanoyl-CoA dioxygenase family)